MTILTIIDLSNSKELDREEMASVHGGFFAVLRSFVADYEAGQYADTPVTLRGRKAGGEQEEF